MDGHVLKRILQLLVGSCAVLLFIELNAPFAHASNDAYGDGAYGSCTYGTCSITLTSNGTVNADVLPSTGTSCSVQSDSVGVTTDSSTGYTLTLSDASTNNSLTNGTNSIAATSGSQSTPIALTANTWGFRVDGIGGFGAGPTSAASNVSPPSETFAAVPPSSSTADTLVTSSSAADPTVTTTVWYGVCADASTASGTYANNVTYTAVIN